MTDQEQAQFEQQIKETFWWYDENHPDFDAYWEFEGCLEWQKQLRYMGAMYRQSGDAKWLQDMRGFIRKTHIGIDTDNVEAFERARLDDYETDGY